MSSSLRIRWSVFGRSCETWPQLTHLSSLFYLPSPCLLCPSPSLPSHSLLFLPFPSLSCHPVPYSPLPISFLFKWESRGSTPENVWISTVQCINFRVFWLSKNGVKVKIWNYFMVFKYVLLSRNHSLPLDCSKLDHYWNMTVLSLNA